MPKGHEYDNVETPDDDHEILLFKTGDTKNITFAKLKASNFIELGTLTPEGVVSARAPSFGRDTAGRLWFKASGTGNTGWVEILTGDELYISGGTF